MDSDSQLFIFQNESCIFVKQIVKAAGGNYKKQIFEHKTRCVMEDIIKIESIDQYNKLFGLETKHPLISVVNLSEAPVWPEHFCFNYGMYCLYIKEVKCGSISYGRQSYDYQEGSIIAFAPGQIAKVDMEKGMKPSGRGILFHPDLIRGTALGQEIRNYSFFSYESNEALHLSEEERQTIMDGLHKIETELKHAIDKHSRRLICANIGLLLDYCMRFYERQFETRREINKDIIARFEHLLDNYFVGDTPQKEGLPSVKYFADKVFLSPNYFGDMIRKQTGKTASDYIQDKVIDLAKQALLSSDKTMTQIAYELGYQYPQHLSRSFKKVVGLTPNEYRAQS